MLSYTVSLDALLGGDMDKGDKRVPEDQIKSWITVGPEGDRHVIPVTKDSKLTYRDEAKHREIAGTVASNTTGVRGGDVRRHGSAATEKPRYSPAAAHEKAFGHFREREPVKIPEHLHWDDVGVLAATAHYKPSHRGEAITGRIDTYGDELGISPEDHAAAKTRLARLGLMDSRGALTQAGKDLHKNLGHDVLDRLRATDRAGYELEQDGNHLAWKKVGERPAHVADAEKPYKPEQGVAVKRRGDKVSVTFPGKPGEETLKKLRGAGFTWNGRDKEWVGPGHKEELIRDALRVPAAEGGAADKPAYGTSAEHYSAADRAEDAGDESTRQHHLKEARRLRGEEDVAQEKEERIKRLGATRRAKPEAAANEEPLPPARGMGEHERAARGLSHLSDVTADFVAGNLSASDLSADERANVARELGTGKSSDEHAALVRLGHTSPDTIPHKLSPAEYDPHVHGLDEKHRVRIADSVKELDKRKQAALEALSARPDVLKRLKAKDAEDALQKLESDPYTPKGMDDVLAPYRSGKRSYDQFLADREHGKLTAEAVERGEEVHPHAMTPELARRAEMVKRRSELGHTMSLEEYRKHHADILPDAEHAQVKAAAETLIDSGRGAAADKHNATREAAYNKLQDDRWRRHTAEAAHRAGVVAAIQRGAHVPDEALAAHGDLAHIFDRTDASGRRVVDDETRHRLAKNIQAAETKGGNSYSQSSGVSLAHEAVPFFRPEGRPDVAATMHMFAGLNEHEHTVRPSMNGQGKIHFVEHSRIKADTPHSGWVKGEKTLGDSYDDAMKSLAHDLGRHKGAVFHDPVAKEYAEKMRGDLAKLGSPDKATSAHKMSAADYLARRLEGPKGKYGTEETGLDNVPGYGRHIAGNVAKILEENTNRYPTGPSERIRNAGMGGGLLADFTEGSYSKHAYEAEKSAKAAGEEISPEAFDNPHLAHRMPKHVAEARQKVREERLRAKEAEPLTLTEVANRAWKDPSKVSTEDLQRLHAHVKEAKNNPNMERRVGDELSKREPKPPQPKPRLNVPLSRVTHGEQYDELARRIKQRLERAHGHEADITVGGGGFDVNSNAEGADWDRLTDSGQKHKDEAIAEMEAEESAKPKPAPLARMRASIVSRRPQLDADFHQPIGTAHVPLPAQQGLFGPATSGGSTDAELALKKRTHPTEGDQYAVHMKRSDSPDWELHPEPGAPKIDEDEDDNPILGDKQHWHGSADGALEAFAREHHQNASWPKYEGEDEHTEREGNADGRMRIDGHEEAQQAFASEHSRAEEGTRSRAAREKEWQEDTATTRERAAADRAYKEKGRKAEVWRKWLDELDSRHNDGGEHRATLSVTDPVSGKKVDRPAHVFKHAGTEDAYAVHAHREMPKTYKAQLAHREKYPDQQFAVTHLPSGRVVSTHGESYQAEHHAKAYRRYGEQHAAKLQKAFRESTPPDLSK